MRGAFYFMKTLVKVMYSELLRIVLFPMRILKIKKNRILFTGLTGGRLNEYSCNPAYLCEYILKNYPGRFEIIWAVSDPDHYRELEKKGIRLIRHFSLSSFPWLLTSKVIVSNGSYAPWFPFRREQYFINTWHGGGAYKKIENSRPDANWATRKRAEFCADNISLFVSSCKMATQKLIRETFAYRGEVLEAGMPRNDFLVQGNIKEAAAKVRRYYGILPGEKIVLYAPTYRSVEKTVTLNANRCLSVLEQRFDAKWKFLYRVHRYQENGGIRVTGSVAGASEYPDMQELLAAADVLLTDYSSNIWDYSFLNRPCFLYTPDRKEYTRNTGFYVGIEKWPFEAAETEEELYRLILEYDDSENRKKIAEHHKMMGCAETGHACEAVTEKILKVTGTGGKNLQYKRRTPEKKQRKRR